jgi:hypothetical protein
MKSLARTLTALVLAAAATLLAACATPVPVSTYNVGYRLVIPPTTNLVTLDGVAGETAWSNGIRFNMEDGGMFPAAMLRAMADASFIYFYTEVEDNGFNEQDVVVIGFNPDGAANNYHRIHIFPCFNGSASCPDNSVGLTPNLIHYKGTLAGGVVTWTQDPGIGTMEAKVATATGATKKWTIEVKIPRGAPFNFVDTNFFGLYIDVARVDPSAGIDGEATQYTWPPNEAIGGASENDILTQLDSGTPLPSHWGNATLSRAFGNGVTISSDDIRTNQPNPSTISLNLPNVFYAMAANNSSLGGTLLPAQQVKATFKIANFGLSPGQSYANVPVSGNPTASVNIAPTVAHTFQTDPWTLTGPQRDDYKNNVHQCIRVELTSTNPGTVFINSSAQRNMDFVDTHSPFSKTAAYTSKGIEPGRRVDFTLRENFINFDPKLPWTSDIRNATRTNPRTYRAQLGSGADGVLDITVTPPNIRITPVAVAIPPGTGGTRPNVRFPVASGELVTVVAFGSVTIDGVPVGGAGSFAARSSDDKPESPTLPDLPGVTKLRPGTLIGSFDGFRTQFVIGTSATAKVPEGSQELQLKLFDTPQGYEKQRGEGLQLEVVRSRLEKWMLEANPNLGRPVRGGDVLVPVGANLPTWQVRGERDTGRFLKIDGKTFRVFEPVGSFGYIVKRIN